MAKPAFLPEEDTAIPSFATDNNIANSNNVLEVAVWPFDTNGLSNNS